MAKASISESIIEIIEPVIQDESLELVDVEYKKLGKTWTLRVYIDKAQGITVDDCQKISRQIEDTIEVDELITNPFVLEVSSPGLDRPLKKEKDFLRYRNKPVEVKTYSPIENRKNFLGTIQDCKEKILYLNEEGASIKIPLDTIAKAKLIIEF
jgi:ribosome maturation factor RimP